MFGVSWKGNLSQIKLLWRVLRSVPARMVHTSVSASDFIFIITGKTHYSKCLVQSSHTDFHGWTTATDIMVLLSEMKNKLLNVPLLWSLARGRKKRKKQNKIKLLWMEESMLTVIMESQMKTSQWMTESAWLVRCCPLLLTEATALLREMMDRARDQRLDKFLKQ